MYKISQEMDNQKCLVSRLTKFLRLKGEQVINGTCKLSLTTSALCVINSVFIDILIHDRIESRDPLENHVTQEFLEDAQFLHDFIGRTPYLKLFHGMQTLRGGINLSYFKNLTTLELRKIPAHLIVGLNTLLHLKALICHRSVGSLKELFGLYTEENKCSDLWKDLKELNVSYNYLEELDDSLGILSNIEILNASHNSLKHLDELMMLDKLVVLNLSYNMLNHLPVLSTCSSFSLKVLMMRSNNLEDLAGLENFANLEELDVSHNCLSEYNALQPLAKLKFLKVLHLENNPISLYKQCREEAIKYFDPGVVLEGLVFDGKRLSAKDILGLQSNASRTMLSESACGHQTSINVIVEDVENVITRSDEHYKTLRHNTPTKTEEIPGKRTTALKEDASALSSSSENTDNVFQTKTKNSKKTRRKIREVVITQPDEENNFAVTKAEGNDDENIPSHILTKKLIETRRKEYGSEWLLPSQSFQTLVIDECIQKVPSNTPVSTSLNVISQSHQLNAVESLVNEASVSHCESRSLRTMNDANDVLSQMSERTCNEVVRKQSAESTDDIQVLDSRLSDDAGDVLDSRSSIEIIPNLVTDIESHLSVYEHHKQTKEVSTNEEDVTDSDSEEENEDRIFVLERKVKEKYYPLFVSIGSRYMKEKDFQSGKLCDFLDLTCLLSIKVNECKMEDVVKHEISLAFDTLKASKQKRVYVFDDVKSAKHMASILQPFADAKTFEDSAVGALECLKCCSQFSKQVARLKVLQKIKNYSKPDSLPSSYDSSKGYIEEADVCPNCGSNMVVEMETIPLPSVKVPSSTSVNMRKYFSKDESPKPRASSPCLGHISSVLYSIMNQANANVSPSSSPKQVHDILATKERNADGLSTSYDLSESVMQGLEQSGFKAAFESRESASFPKMRRNSSDVTIHSNPSQSSIAVISSDSDCDMPLDVIPEMDSLCSPSPISPPLLPNFQNEVSVSSMIPATVSTSTSTGSACTAIEEFEDPQRPEAHAANKSKNFLTDSHDRPAELKTHVAELSQACNDSVGYVSDKEFQDCTDSFIYPKMNNSNHSDESSSLMNILSKKETISYENFSSVDHRLKLYLEFTIFGINEELDATLEASVVLPSNDSEFKGLFVFSSKKIYVMRLLKDISDDVATCVEKVYSWPLNQLKVIKLLPGSQGFAATCASDKTLVFLIQDSDYCNCFISCITDIIRHRLQDTHFPKFETSITEALNQINMDIFSPYFSTVTSPEKDLEVVLYLLVFWSSVSLDQKPSQRVALIVTASHLFVAKVSYLKQIGQRKQVDLLLHYQLLECQKLSNLIQIQIKGNLRDAKFNFLDEQNTECCWTVSAKTKSSLFSLINSLKNPWEELFRISLPLCLYKDQETDSSCTL